MRKQTEPTKCSICINWEYDEDDKVYYCGLSGEAIIWCRQNADCVNFSIHGRRCIAKTLTKKDKRASIADLKARDKILREIAKDVKTVDLRDRVVVIDIE